jgi:hypothetical protein
VVLFIFFRMLNHIARSFYCKSSCDSYLSKLDTSKIKSLATCQIWVNGIMVFSPNTSSKCITALKDEMHVSIDCFKSRPPMLYIQLSFRIFTYSKLLRALICVLQIGKHLFCLCNLPSKSRLTFFVR